MKNELQKLLNQKADIDKQIKICKASIISEYREDLIGKIGTVQTENYTFNIPKKITWDQELLASLYEEIGETAHEYIGVKYNVSEASYNAYPTIIKDKFTPARTVSTGATTIKIKD